MKTNILIRYSVAHPKTVVAATLALTFLAGFFIPRIKVDTDPENMLSEKESVRVFYSQVKEEFAIHDFVLLGSVNERHPDGVFNPETLGRVHLLTEAAARMPGVIAGDMQSFPVVDDMVPAGRGAIRFYYLMKDPPKTREECLYIRDRAMANPLFHGTLVSEDGKALTIFIPLDRKDRAHGVYTELRKIIKGMDAGTDDFHITGLPVAEDTFGVEMFIQMGISAPAAMAVIFCLLWFFFRRVKLIVIPLVLAMVCTIITMGALIGMGFTVHIMSSMIPIFIMPYSVADSVHILSAFYDAYPRFKDRGKTIESIMQDLFVPCFYTSITTVTGFASLAMTPIPPVRVFGAYVAFGVALAWVLTMTFVPALIMVFVKEKSLEGYGFQAKPAAEADAVPRNNPLTVFLDFLARTTLSRPKRWLTVMALLTALGAYGLTKVQVNDNPIKWFGSNHPIRVADRVLNQHFGGTYELYLILEAEDPGLDRRLGEVQALFKNFREKAAGTALEGAANVLSRPLGREWKDGRPASGRDLDLALQDLIQQLDGWRASSGMGLSAKQEDMLGELTDKLEDMRLSLHLFKQPALLEYVQTMQRDIQSGHPEIGKSNSLADLVRKVHMELHEGEPAESRIPEKTASVAQCILATMNSHTADDLWHLVNRSYDRLSVMLQLKSGDNKDVESVERLVESYLAEHPAPVPLKHSFAGLSYINVVWQEKMVKGMNRNLLSSFVAVWLMMVFLFKSWRWGSLSMLPLAFTIAFIYGMVGLVGKDYDMPVAILSSIALGMSVDFAIHFLQVVREKFNQAPGASTGEWRSGLSPRWEESARFVFQTPARAIFRNAVVVALGFTPLLLSPLVPYNTVGVLIGSIMVLSAGVTLILLPAVISAAPALFFWKPKGKDSA